MAIVGASASGKSTLARALAGVWPLREGSVRIDGAEYDQWDQNQLGKHIGYLPQDIELFAGTVAENIARLGPSHFARRGQVQGSPRGRLTVNVVVSLVDATSRVPPWAATIDATIASPRPLPPLVRARELSERQNRSNARDTRSWNANSARSIRSRSPRRIARARPSSTGSVSSNV